MDDWWRDLRLLRALMNHTTPPPSRRQHWAVHGRRAERRGRNRMIAVLFLGLVVCFVTGLCLSCAVG
jgi:hypothetical protein